MFEKNIIDLTKDELLDPEFIPSIYDEYEGEEREEVLKQVLLVARDRKVLTKVKNMMEKQENVQKLENEDGTALLYMGVKGADNVKVTIDNYIQAILHTPTLKNKILYNEFSGKFERVAENGKIRNWTDVDDAWLLNEIEKEYGIHEPRKCVSALNCCIEQIKYHPIKMLIEEKPWDGVPRIDKILYKYMGCDDDDYSTQVSRMIFYGGISRLYNPGVKFDYMPIFIGEQGCVDCDTEFFTGTSWKKIQDYEIGDKVLQYNTNGTANLVEPLRYIKQPKEYLYHFKTKYGIDQCLSSNHNVYYITSKGNLYHKTMGEIKKCHEETSFKGRFITAFDYAGEGISLKDDEIRLMVACFADGSIQRNKMRFNLKKSRKVERLKQLLDNLNIDYSYKYSDSSEYHVFYFNPVMLEKHFPSNWYNCSKEQFKIIADEVMYWDGDYKKHNRYVTTCKQDADFIQFVFNSLGYYCSIKTIDRVGYKNFTNNKEYSIKSIYYEVSYSKEYLKSLNKSKEHKTKIETYKTKDGFDYCFTVPSGMLVLRRNNCVFITGNCGKSTMVNWLNIHPKFFREIVTIEGKDGYDILRYGWVCEFPELLAMVKHQTNEAMKAYVTRQVDSFRPAYGRNYVDIPRHCIFIGTTNTYEFLTDNDNRRYLPIVVNAKKGELFKKEKEVKEYILNCWREAKYLLDHNKIYLTIPNEYEDIVEQHRQMATEDDPEIGLIEDYLNKKQIGDKVCAMDVFTNPMGKLRKNYNKINARYITNIMSKFKNWQRSKTSTNFEEFGKQRYWTRIG